jgi:serine/threonine-protein kinase
MRAYEIETTREWLTAGTTVRNYVIGSRIAATGVGEVYLAKERATQREVALKLLPAPPHCSPVQLQALTRQISLQKPPQHPNICEIYEAGVTENGKLFVAAEYVKGQSLDEMLRAGATCDIAKIAQQTATALHAAHAAGRLHADLKLSNLLLTRGGNVKVLDFGLALFKRCWQPLGQNGLPPAHLNASALRHLSPEHVDGTPLTAQSDLFSLGTILYELLTGQAPFNGASPAEICTAIVTEKPYAITAYAPCADPLLCSGVFRLLEKNPHKRPNSAVAFLAGLQQARAQAAPKARIARAPQDKTASARPSPANDWRMVSDFGKGAWQVVFSSGLTFLIGGAALMAAGWSLLSFVSLIGAKP